jgi:hypothetical protein
MAAEQGRCPETQHLLGGTSLKLAFCQAGTQRMAGDISTGTFRPIVRLKFRKDILAHFHNVAHPGRPASCRIISSRFVWRGLSSDVTAWAHGCLACQRGKIHHHTRLALQPIPIPQRRFSHLHVDLVGPLQYSNNFNYIFTITDCTSKWIEAIPLSDTSAAACAKALTFTWISHFGVPETITSDRGLQFTSNLWLKLCETLHISHRQTTAYHPESNGAGPALSPSESGPGTRSSPSAASRPARPRTPRLAAYVAAADRLVRTEAALPQPSGSRFQTPWFLHLPFRRHHETVLEPFSYPARRFLHARRLHRCHRHSTHPVNGHRQRGWTSDLFSFQPRPELGGSPVDTCLHP